jgi:hypothetical protein
MSGIDFDDVKKDKRGHIEPVNGKRKRIPKWVENMAFDLVANGATNAILSEKYKKSINTCSYWRNQSEVKELMAKIKDDLYQHALSMYQGLSSRAVEVLARYMGYDPETGEFSIPDLSSDVRQVATDIVKGTGIHKSEVSLVGSMGVSIGALSPEDDERISRELGRIFNDQDRKKKKLISQD